MSRWTPVVSDSESFLVAKCLYLISNCFQLKDLVEDAIDGKLDSTHFPYLSDQRGQAKSQAPAR